MAKRRTEAPEEKERLEVKLRSSTLLTVGLWLIVLAFLCPSARALAKVPPDLDKLVLAKFGPLRPAEVRLLRKVKVGQVAWGGMNTDYSSPENDPANAALYNWPSERSIRAELIRWLCIWQMSSKVLDPRGIYITAAWIDGILDLSHLDVPVPLTLSRCHIPKGINLEFAVLPFLALDGSWTGPIEGKGLSVHDNLILGDGFHSAGGVQLYGAKIGGEIYCAGANLSNPGRAVLSLGLSTIGSELELKADFESDGIVQLEGARIGGDLVVDTANFTGDKKNGLIASGATIGGTFYWTNVSTTKNTVLDLSYATLGVLYDDEVSWPQKDELILDGLAYNSIGGGPADAATRLKWIELQPYGFKPQPYQQLAKVFREGGQEVDAREVLIAKESAMMRYVAAEVFSRGQPEPKRPDGFAAIIVSLLISLFREVKQFALWITIDYGYEPLRALWFIGAFVILGALTFHWGYRAGAIVPTDKDAYDTVRKSGAPPPNYQPFNSVIYSLETFLPLVELYEAKYWLPRPNPDSANNSHVVDAGTLMRLYLWVHILLGWFFASMLVAGLSGLVQKS
jgi:hypothetical protein